jgi:UDP:flavonoid glycosyltransferase YjiC (YdhE family)
MADCKYVACTAGFESLAEAAYLGKPLFLVPVENHIEQQVNAIDAVRAGLGVADKSFNLDRLAELPERLDNTKYLAWLNRAESILLGTLERVVHESRGEKRGVEYVQA